MRLGAFIAPPLLALALAAPAAGAAADARVAALQVALRANGVYDGTIDGLSGPQTAEAVRVIQARAKITVDGVVGPETRKALGKLGRPGLGTRTLETACEAGTSRRCSSGWRCEASLPARSTAEFGGAHRRGRSALPGVGRARAGRRRRPGDDARAREAACDVAGRVVAAALRSVHRRASGRAACACTPASTSRRRAERRSSPRDRCRHRRRAGSTATGTRSRSSTSSASSTVYAHLSAILVKPGAQVVVGQPIGARRRDRLGDGTAPALRAARARRGDRPGSRVQVATAGRRRARCSATDRSRGRCGTRVRRPRSARARSTCSPCPSSEAVRVHTCAGS